MKNNRIRELRERRGWSADDLAQRAGTYQRQISRLENGERKLTAEWMMRIANALEVPPEDLLPALSVGSFEEERQPYEAETPADLRRALAAQNQFLFSPGSNALELLGFGPETPILFDMSKEACADVQTGDIVIVQVISRDDESSARTLLRQFIAPGLLTTNRSGRNVSFHMEDEKISAQIRGVHKLRRATPNGQNKH